MLNIALNTFREIIRNKFLYIILVFAIAFIFFTMTLGSLSMNDDKKIIIDF
jgi:hypothetical protein